MKATILAGLAAGLALAGCGEPDTRLQGERLALRPEARIVAAPNEARPIDLPAARTNAEWTHRYGAPDHRILHPALGPRPELAFRVPIGEGDSRRARITADPVVAGGRVFALDARGRVTATSTAGAPLWSAAALPRRDAAGDASGGGLAAAGGRVFVATGYGELTALDAETGATLWVQDLDAPGGSAPTVQGDLVYVVARDGTAWAVETANGRIRWTLRGTPSEANVGGGPGVAVAGDIAIFPFPSGEVLAAFPEGGLRRWSTVVTGRRDGHAAATITDITGDPVIDGAVTYVGNVSGRLAALSTESGAPVWSVPEGAMSPVWPTGGSVFLVSDLGELLRLDARDGSPVWRVALPDFEEENPRRRKTRIAHYGPVLAGGRLVVASSDGLLRGFDPVSGALVESIPLPGGAASNPAVAGGVLYVVNKRGELLAFR